MKNILDFWNKDLINKAMVGILLLLLAGFAGVLYVFFNVPLGDTGQSLGARIFASATPTVDMPARFTALAETAMVAKTPAYLRGPATITPIGGPFMTDTPTPATETATAIPGVEISPTPTLQVTSLASPQPTSASLLDFSGVRCILNVTPQAGRVLEIVDGVTAKVMIDKLVYTVRYIAVDHPQVTTYADAASAINGQLVWGKDVQLYTDPVVKDTVGQIYRYVVVGDKLVNLELLQKGFALAVDLPIGNACYQAFLVAQQTAQSAHLGMWK